MQPDSPPAIKDWTSSFILLYINSIPIPVPHPRPRAKNRNVPQAPPVEGGRGLARQVISPLPSPALGSRQIPADQIAVKPRQKQREDTKRAEHNKQQNRHNHMHALANMQNQIVNRSTQLVALQDQIQPVAQIVPFPDAVAKPSAVMVPLKHALLAAGAVSRPDRLVQIAHKAKPWREVLAFFTIRTHSNHDVFFLCFANLGSRQADPLDLHYLLVRAQARGQGELETFARPRPVAVRGLLRRQILQFERVRVVGTVGEVPEPLVVRLAVSTFQGLDSVTVRLDSGGGDFERGRGRLLDERLRMDEAWV